MDTKAFIIAAIICCFYLLGYSQNRNSVWCFGDSAGIDYSVLTAPVSFATGLDTRGSCASISDSFGNLLFYAETRAAQPTFRTTLVFNANHQIMLSGDSIMGGGWYHELIILPDPGNINLYYLFSIGGIGTNVDKGLFYSVIDMTLDGGLGAVITKNIQLQNFNMVDCLSAVKHGNGRDWWLIFRKSDFLTGGGNSEWYQYLISPSGITNFSQQTIGSINRTSGGQIDFSPSGNKLAFACLTGVIEVFDFDRCTGQLSSPVTIEQDPFAPPYPMYWGVSFSNDISKLYVTSYDYTGYLFQYDLNNPNISSTKDTLWAGSIPINVGKLKRMDDGKIYLSCAWDDTQAGYYPYPDSIRNYINENLSVINLPDSLGVSCSFQPFSFYLGGKRTYIGLPNNPDYQLGPLSGSICDTLTAISELPIKQYLVNIYPNPVFNYTTVTGTEKINSISIFDISGQTINEIELATQQFYSYSLNLEKYPPGIYFVTIKSDSFVETKKVVKL
ncbi:MAG: T9SS type A sorting domain-containing protein [Bacteroidia bacterium]